MSMGLLVTFIGVIVAGLAGVLGVWMERDPKGGKAFPVVFSVLILGASTVELVHALASQVEAEMTDAKMARLLGSMAELAASGDNPALSSYVGTELAIAARANPNIVKKMEASVEAKGGDPDSVMKTAKEGRRLAAGLAAEPPKKGEKPQLSPAMVAVGGGAKSATLATGLADDAGLDIEIPDEIPLSVDDAKGMATETATKAVDDAKETATKAVDDAKKEATETVDNAKKEAEEAALAKQKEAEEAAEAKKKEAEEAALAKQKEAEEAALAKKKAAEKKAKQEKNKAKNKGKDALKGIGK
mgnify:CR=1 FL=1